ncbi:MAG: SurA N-terminal domain-containing protein, partial [Novosphingobium sp.]|nr:SurA N-terminal domain-containing protein [Novosphingobium sp.]
MMSRLKITRTIGTAALAFGMAAVAVTPVLAQGANSPLNIPANPVMFGKNDPNVRRATAIINGEIVTGTDVEQRLALIVSANGNKVDGEELDRLRMQVLRNLIDETLQIQEAKAADTPVDDAQVDATYDRVATQN